MDLRPGYKQTEVGAIPEEWEVASVGKLATFASGQGISVSALHRQSSDFPVPVYGGNGIAGYTNIPLVIHKSIVVGRVGQKCGEVYVTDGPAWITDNALYPRRISRPLDIRFFALALEAAGLNDVKNRNDLPLVTQSILHAVPIAWPRDVREQSAVADALGDVDALLGALTRLIVKKRGLKQAAMQELLTGQTRLPGFSGDWGVKRLGDLGVTYGGLTGKAKSDFGDGSARYITFLNIMNNVVINTEQFEPVKVQRSERQNEAVRGDLFFNGSSETPEEVGMCSVLLAEVENLFLNSFCFGFRLRAGSKDDAVYLAYFFRSNKGRELLYSLAQGATRYNLSKTSLIKLVFPLPEPAEQRAIAAVLSDMDAEIAALEERLAKTRALKQGLMQELLTGRIRLVPPADSEKHVAERQMENGVLSAD